MNQLVEWSQGNGGAVRFLTQVYLNPESDLVQSMIIDNKLKRCESIRGTNAYVLWSDLCNQDMDNVVEVCENVPDDILEEACNRQDYSGRELIAEYVKFMEVN